MGLLVSLLLLVLWLVLAWRSFQRGDLPLAGILLAVGIALTIYRLRLISRHKA